jgi:hypothetical protein
MSTDFSVDLQALDGSITTITISDSINPIPGSDTWAASNADDLACAGGLVSSWGQKEADLTGPVGAKSLVLDGFSGSTKRGDTGSGDKNYVDGAFPGGSFTWTCTRRK